MRKTALNAAIIVILTLSMLLAFPVIPVKAVTPTVKVLNPDSTHDKTLVDTTYWNASVTYDTKYDTTPAGPGDIVFHTDTRQGNMFYIDVYCADVVGLWCWQVNFSWDPALLEVIYDPMGSGIGPFVPPTSKFKFETTPEPAVDNASGLLLIGSTRYYPKPGVDGSDYLARIPVIVKKGAGYLEHYFCDLKLEMNTFLKNSTMGLIDSIQTNGYYEIFWVIPGKPSIYVSPVEYKAGRLYDDVKIDVRVRNVAPAWEIIGFQFILRFNASLLDPIGITPGTFLETFNTTGETVIYFEAHDYMGDPALPEGYNAYFVGVLTLPGAGGVYYAPWPEGEGLLVSLHFNATLETIAPEEAWTDLSFTYLENLPGISADNQYGYAINHYIPLEPIYYETQTGGMYRAPIKILGLALDLYSQYPGEYGGRDFGMPSDSFAPQQQVELYAKLTYNADPVQQKLVGFQIVDEDKEFYIYREGTTNDLGVAHVSVRLPWPCVDPERTLGEWTARATAEVAEKKANDTMPFKVWWHVEVVSIEPKQSRYVKRKPTGADPLTFTMVFRTYRMQPVPVNLTAVVYDELGFFIGSDVLEIAQFGWGAYGHYCTFYNGTWEISIPMPTNAMVGLCKVYGNAFNNLPWDYGTAYCPEVPNTKEFRIVLP